MRIGDVLAAVTLGAYVSIRLGLGAYVSIRLGAYVSIRPTSAYACVRTCALGVYSPPCLSGPTSVTYVPPSISSSCARGSSQASVFVLLY